ncbi:zinc-finger homeodomain protein 2-like [Bidens hawaiensis]|uniref:zinc-finger homeodomain protein 2-like n=1 Tax=Bidens hawaiensis TaxID=980011 RepID=UPI004049DD02
MASQEQAAAGNMGSKTFEYQFFQLRECSRNRTLEAIPNIDGCLRFSPKGANGTRDALICGACNCHRSFHRRELVIVQTPETRQCVNNDQPSALGVNLGAGSSGAGGNSEKRARTKFTREQKDRMLAFAQGLGWRVKKEDEASVEGFCAEIGADKKFSRCGCATTNTPWVKCSSDHSSKTVFME